jgi:hypothetical protein
MTTDVTTDDTSTLLAPCPFANSSKQIQLCWALGYHDAVNGIDPKTGQDALVSFAINAQDNLADREGELAASTTRLEQLTTSKSEANDQLLPTFAQHSVGFWPYFMVAVYLILAAIAVLAEFPLSGLTVGGSLQIATPEQMRAFQTLTVWALALMLCLVGFSIKLIVDVFDHRKGHRWLEIAFAVLVLGLSVTCIVCVAELRRSMGREQISERQSAAADKSTNRSDIETRHQLDLEFSKAQKDVSDWAASTFMWVTIALPCFSAVCLVVALHQIRNYRKHNRAVKTLDGISLPLDTEAESQARLKWTIQADSDHLKQLEVDDPLAANFEKWAVAVYCHGFETGQAARLRQLDKEPLYARLLTRLNRKVA